MTKLMWVLLWSWDGAKKKKKLIVRLFCLSLRNQNLSVSSFHLIEVAGQILCTCYGLKGRTLTPSNNVPSHGEEQRGMSLS